MKLIEYYEGRWKQEYVEKTELLTKNMELKRKYEEKLEEMWNDFELVYSTTQVAFWDTPSNQVKSGEGSFHETKGKRKVFNENKLVMIERMNRYFKKRVVVTKCEVCKKTHTGMCYLKWVLVVDTTNLDINWGTTQNNG